MSAQKSDSATSTKPDKCFAFIFDYDKPIEYIEVDCAKMESTATETTQEKLIAIEQRKLKMLAYQEKLKLLGYDVDITGRLDGKTSKAHEIYLRKKMKDQKRRLRAERKASKSQ